MIDNIGIILRLSNDDFVHVSYCCGITIIKIIVYFACDVRRGDDPI
jgi:hypothetical protein